MKTHFGFNYFLALCFCVTSSAFADVVPSSKRIEDPRQQETLLKGVQGFDQYRSALKDGGKIVTSSVVKVTRKLRNKKKESDIVTILQYSYAKGETIRTIYNLSEKTLVSVETLEAYPTPLAPDEAKAARDLAAEKNETAANLLTKTKPENLQLEIMPMVISNKDSPFYRKRLVGFRAFSKSTPSESVLLTLNLTDNTIISDSPSAE